MFFFFLFDKIKLTILIMLVCYAPNIFDLLLKLQLSRIWLDSLELKSNLNEDRIFKLSVIKPNESNFNVTSNLKNSNVWIRIEFDSLSVQSITSTLHLTIQTYKFIEIQIWIVLFVHSVEICWWFRKWHKIYILKYWINDDRFETDHSRSNKKK